MRLVLRLTHRRVLHVRLFVLRGKHKKTTFLLKIFLPFVDERHSSYQEFSDCHNFHVQKQAVLALWFCGLFMHSGQSELRAVFVVCMILIFGVFLV